MILLYFNLDAQYYSNLCPKLNEGNHGEIRIKKSFNILLLNSGEDLDWIRVLIKSKVPNCSIVFHSLNNSLNIKSTKQDSVGLSKYDLCILKGKEVSQRPNQEGISEIYWEDSKELSSKIDIFLQLYRYQHEFPLKLRDWKLTQVLHNSKDCIIYKAIGCVGESVAIKRFKFNSEQLSQKAIDDYLESISLQCGIYSNGLVNYFEGGVRSNAFYLVMEYLPSGNLRHCLDTRDRVLPLKHAMEWFKEIANALDLVHQAGLIHRDLKIGNIMLREDGSLALTDYGVSKDILLNVGFLSAEEIHGSPHYLSPELISGDLCSQSSDIYSLGIIFFELLTGERPFKANNPHDLLMAHILKPIPILSEELKCFQNFLGQVLAKTPYERFKNMTDLLQSFDLSYEAYKEKNQLKMTLPHFSHGFSSLNK